jgi:transposase
LISQVWFTLVGRARAHLLSFDWGRRCEDREDDPQARLDAICGRSTELSAALELADPFAALIRRQSPLTLTDWLVKAESSACQELRWFAARIRRDEAAVQAAVRGPWSPGPVEGHVNRLKMIKRQMYGRAGLVLLRARVVRPPNGYGQRRCCWTWSGCHHRE